MRMICEKRSLSSIELSRAEDRAEIELKIRPGSADLGEPECYYFEEYEAPRMNPSVVAATRGLDFSKTRRRSPRPPHSLGVDLFSPLQGGSLPKSLTEPLLSSQGKEKTTRREGGRLPRPDAPARPPDSIESKQRKLNSIELRSSDLEEPLFEIRIRVRSNAVPGLLQTMDPYNSFEQPAPPRPREPHTFQDEEEEEEEPQARSSEPQEATPVAWSAPDGRLPSPDHDLASQFFGGH
ncbi:unnamed protein product [Microthlaspi erraticum]|uniref:Uncharacterized protein n=1 Tax=Microthlaspi erraticum TaxID=1685480 RepID=A0A6D2L805_9BRAS|nr:unnamed protein product [Microthlaspi erraticum]